MNPTRSSVYFGYTQLKKKKGVIASDSFTNKEQLFQVYNLWKYDHKLTFLRLHVWRTYPACASWFLSSGSSIQSTKWIYHRPRDQHIMMKNMKELDCARRDLMESKYFSLDKKYQSCDSEAHASREWRKTKLSLRIIEQSCCWSKGSWDTKIVTLQNKTIVLSGKLCVVLKNGIQAKCSFLLFSYGNNSLILKDILWQEVKKPNYFREIIFIETAQ